MEDIENIEKKYVYTAESTIPVIINNNFDKDFLFYILAICGLLLYVGTNLYISFIAADYQLFVWHPILMTYMILFSTLGIIFLQKAVKKHEKARSLLFHKWMQLFNLGCLISGFIIVCYNKTIKGKTHYKTYHAKVGLATFIFYIIQSIAGLTMIYFPTLFGVSKSIKYYKLHRLVGYIILTLIWSSAIISTQTRWITMNFNHDWIWVVSIGMVFIGIVGRIDFNKIRIIGVPSIVKYNWLQNR